MCWSVFTTHPPAPLQEQPAVVLFLERALVSWSLAMDEHGKHEYLRESGRQSVIPGRIELYCSSMTLLMWAWAFLFSDPLEVASTRDFYSSTLDNYNESQGPIGGLGAGKTLCCMTPPTRSSKWCLQRCGYARSYRLPHYTRSAVWHRVVASLGTVAVPDECNTALALCCSHIVATRLTVLPAQSYWTTP
jgi:hypothetical protein